MLHIREWTLLVMCTMWHIREMDPLSDVHIGYDISTWHKGSVHEKSPFLLYSGKQRHDAF
jgi:hypothetical protein